MKQRLNSHPNVGFDQLSHQRLTARQKSKNKLFTRPKYRWKFTILSLLILAATVSKAQVQSPQQKQTRESFERYFQLNRQIPVSDTTKGRPRIEAAKIIKKAPGREAKFNRLLKYQEERTAQPDVNVFMANNRILEEIATGDERDFAQLIFWNEAALRITANDHTAPAPGSSLATHPFEQVGPARTSRAMAIVHIAMFEAVNTIYREYQSYKGIQDKIFARTGISLTITPQEVSVRHAIAYAAYNALKGLYVEKTQDLDQTLLGNLTQIQVAENLKNTGQRIGEAAASAILDERHFDGSEFPDPPVADFLTADPQKWQRDPLNADPSVALGANWMRVRPFVIQKAEQFRPSPPPTINTDRYKNAFTEVFTKGGDSNAGQRVPPGNSDRQPTPNTRTDQETFIGKFWGYDATALLCAPPRLYNMIATSLALSEQRATFSGPTSALQLAQFLAVINVAMADAAIGAWEAKYYYLYPRPVTAIRAATPATAPISAEQSTRFWSPLGAPVTNARPDRVNFTPPFPAYPSGHATFGGALFQIFRRYWGNDAIQFTFTSDEYNGFNSDPGELVPRPKTPVIFDSFSMAERQNADSRIYLGIHWRFDADEGIIQGNNIGNFVFDNFLKKLQ